MKLFEDLTNHAWRIKFTGSSPMMHTLREFSEEEKASDLANEDLYGVRTFWFGAHHWRGLPEMLVGEEHQMYDAFAWVPKRLMNEYFTREYHEVFIDAVRTR